MGVYPQFRLCFRFGLVLVPPILYLVYGAPPSEEHPDNPDTDTSDKDYVLLSSPGATQPQHIAVTNNAEAPRSVWDRVPWQRLPLAAMRIAQRVSTSSFGT